MSKNNLHNPKGHYLLISFILIISIVLVTWNLTEIHPLWIYLLTLTLITFCFYGYDKYRASHQKGRIPEIVLHALALAGGSMGALAGQYIFHHKTKKLKFQIVFILIAIVQIGLFIWWIISKR